MFVSHPYVKEKEYNEVMKQKPTNSLLPKTDISAIDADKYCEIVGGRLPTEAELENQCCLLWEWTSTSERDNNNNHFRVVRGGSWYFHSGASGRVRYNPGLRSDLIGFRCLKK